MKSIDLKNIFSKLGLPRKGDFKTVSIKAHFDWKIIIVLFFVLSVAVVSANLWLFFRIGSGKAFLSSAPQVSKSENVDFQNINNAVKYFGDRQKILEDLRAGSLSITDPSL